MYWNWSIQERVSDRVQTRDFSGLNKRCHGDMDSFRDFGVKQLNILCIN